MKILFCGLGSIGRRQARLILEGFSHEVLALRTYQGQDKTVVPGVTELNSWTEVDRHHPEVAFITNPTSCHIKTALECAKRGMKLFVEKPIDASTQQLEELLEIVAKRGLVSYVAYPLRFHPLITKLKGLLKDRALYHSRFVCASFLPSFRAGADYRVSYSCYASQGGGVLLDLSHEIDLAEFLRGEVLSLSGAYGRMSPITVDSEDYADLILKHSFGTSTVHLNYFSKNQQRSVEVETTDGFLRADLIEGELTVQEEGQLKSLKLPVVQDEMYKNQLNYFFSNLENPEMMNNLPAASRLFKKIIEFRERR